MLEKSVSGVTNMRIYTTQTVIYLLITSVNHFDLYFQTLQFNSIYLCMLFYAK